jgi:hypothetical protein
VKVGDLVELSAYGKKRLGVNSRNSENWGIVLAPHDYHGAWKVRWYKPDGTSHTLWNKRKEIKHFKLNKDISHLKAV